MGIDSKNRPRGRVLEFAVSGMLLVGPALMACDDHEPEPNMPYLEETPNDPPGPTPNAVAMPQEEPEPEPPHVNEPEAIHPNPNLALPTPEADEPESE